MSEFGTLAPEPISHIRSCENVSVTRVVLGAHRQPLLALKRMSGVIILIYSRKMPPRPITVIPNFDDTMREFMKIFSGNPVLYREGLTKHPWVEPILWQTRGLRQNYLTNHPRLSARDNAIQSTPPGNLRKRTRRIAPGTADLFRNRILPKVIFI